MWTDELVTLRSVQSFPLMDIENYRRYIWSVSSYAEDLNQTLKNTANQIVKLIDKT